jgi:hypothetical protein
VFFSQKPNKCLVSVKKTQQTHALFLHSMWFSFSVADMCFLCFVHFLCFVGVMCVRWWWKGELISVEILTVKRPVDVDDAAE